MCALQQAFAIEHCRYHRGIVRVDQGFELTILVRVFQPPECLCWYEHHIVWDDRDASPIEIGSGLLIGCRPSPQDRECSAKLFVVFKRRIGLRAWVRRVLQYALARPQPTCTQRVDYGFLRAASLAVDDD